MATRKPQPPLKSAPKAEWVEYAIGRGRASYEAWDLTLEQLHEEYGETPQDRLTPPEVPPAPQPAEPTPVDASIDKDPDAPPKGRRSRG